MEAARQLAILQNGQEPQRSWNGLSSSQTEAQSDFSQVSAALTEFAEKGTLTPEIIDTYASGYQAFLETCPEEKEKDPDCTALLEQNAGIQNQIGTIGGGGSGFNLRRFIQNYGYANAGLAYSLYPEDAHHLGVSGEFGIYYPITELGSFPIGVGAEALINPHLTWMANPDHRLMGIEVYSALPIVMAGTEIPTGLAREDLDTVNVRLKGAVLPRSDVQVGKNPADRPYYPDDGKFPLDAKLELEAEWWRFSLGVSKKWDDLFGGGWGVTAAYNLFQGGQQ